MANSRWNTFVNTTFSNLTSRSGTQKLAGCLLAKHLYQFTAPHWGSETPRQSCQFKPLDSRTCQTAVTDAPFALVHSVQEDPPPRAEERTHNGQTWIGSDGAPCQPSLPITHLPFLANLCTGKRSSPAFWPRSSKSVRSKPSVSGNERFKAVCKVCKAGGRSSLSHELIDTFSKWLTLVQSEMKRYLADPKRLNSSSSSRRRRPLMMGKAAAHRPHRRHLYNCNRLGSLFWGA